MRFAASSTGLTTWASSAFAHRQMGGPLHVGGPTGFDDFCRDDIPNGLFTDQRWIDLAPALFDGVAIIRSSRFNVAPWNLTTRNISGNLGEGFVVDGEPLGFYHFTGFDSGAHHVMIGKYCAANPSIDALVKWYEKETSGWKTDPLSHQHWAFGQFDDGLKITRAQRLIFRSRADLQKKYPNPFAASPDDDLTYSGWCRQHGHKEYPDLLPTPLANADRSRVSGALIPSIAPPAGSLRPLKDRLWEAAVDLKQARLLGTQVRQVLKREGIRGLIARIRRAANSG